MKMWAAIFGGLAALFAGWGGYKLIKAASWKPKGKGVFFRGLKTYGTPAETVAKLKAQGATWVLLIGDSWHKNMVSTYYPSLIGEYAKALRDAGIDVWLWGWVDPESPHFEEWPAHYGRVAKQTGAKGVLVNAEKPFYGKKWNAAAEWLVDALHAQGLKVIVSSYGSVKSHPNFAWEGFRKADGGAPMIYDLSNKLGTKYPPRSVAEWSELFDVVIPVWGMASSGGQTIEQEIALSEATPLPSDAVAVWDAYWLKTKKDRGAWYASFDTKAKAKEGAALV